MKFQTIQFSISIVVCLRTVKWQNSSISSNSLIVSIQFSLIWSIDRTLSGATTPDQSRSGSDGNEEVLHIIGVSPSDCLVSNPGHSLEEGESYPSAEMHTLYSTAPAGWAKNYHVKKCNFCSVNVIQSFYIHLCGLMWVYIYIYSHPQTDLFRSIRTHQCG